MLVCSEQQLHQPREPVSSFGENVDDIALNANTAKKSFLIMVLAN